SGRLRSAARLAASSSAAPPHEPAAAFRDGLQWRGLSKPYPAAPARTRQPRRRLLFLCAAIARQLGRPAPSGPASPTVSAPTAPRAPTGFGPPRAVSTAVWRSILASSSAPTSTTTTDSQIQVMNP